MWKGASVFLCGVIALLGLAQTKAETRTKPCKFGDRIEYGHLGEEIKVGGSLDAYLSRANNSNPKGGVIIIQDIFGWELSNTRAIADMLSANNFTAILPDSYEGRPAWNRSRPRSEYADWRKDKHANETGHVISTCIEYLKTVESIDKIAIVGFCWGGRVVHYAMARRNDLVAGVSCYGMIGDDEPEFGQLQSPTLFIYGKADRGYPPKRINTLRRALRRNATAKYSIRGYENQGHGFLHRKLTSPDDPDKEQIYAARKMMIRWLNVHIRKTPDA